MNCEKCGARLPREPKDHRCDDAVPRVTLESFLVRAQKIRAEIELEKNTVEHWNRLHPDEKPLVVDYSEVETMLDETLSKLLRKAECKIA